MLDFALLDLRAIFRGLDVEYVNKLVDLGKIVRHLGFFPGELELSPQDVGLAKFGDKVTLMFHEGLTDNEAEDHQQAVAPCQYKVL